MWSAILQAVRASIRVVLSCLTYVVLSSRFRLVTNVSLLAGSESGDLALAPRLASFDEGLSRGFPP